MITLKSLIVLLGLAIMCFSWSVQARNYPDFAVAPFMHVQIVADDMQFNGVPMRIVEFNSTQPRARVIEFYRGTWGDRVVETDMGDRYILAHRDGDYLLTVDIAADTGMGAKGTLSTTAFFDPRVRPSDTLGEGFPMLPQSTVFNDIKSVDGSNYSRTLVINSNHNLQRTYDFYQRRFYQEGWREVVPASGSGEPVQAAGRAILLNRRNDELNIAFVPEGRGTMVVAILITRR